MTPIGWRTSFSQIAVPQDAAPVLGSAREEKQVAYRLSGTYVGHCDCQQLCACAVDGPPTGRDGQCHGLLEAFKDQEGKPTTMSNAGFGFAPVFRLGQSSGSSGILGESFEANYGEAAEFEYTS